jgi:hypothetical protein
MISNFSNSTANSINIDRNKLYRSNLGLLPMSNNGLVYSLDAGNVFSYPGNGSTWTNLAWADNASLSNTTYSSANTGGITFNGTSSSGSSAISYPSQSSSTTEAVFRLNQIPNNPPSPLFGYIGRGGYSNPTQGSLSVGTGPIVTFTLITTTNGYVSVGTPIELNKIYHVVAHKNMSNGTMAIYLNGNQIQTANFDQSKYAQWPSAGNFIYENNINIGGGVFSGTKYTNCTIFMGRIYNRILTQSEISQNWSSVSSRYRL